MPCFCCNRYESVNCNSEYFSLSLLLFNKRSLLEIQWRVLLLWRNLNLCLRNFLRWYLLLWSGENDPFLAFFTPLSHQDFCKTHFCLFYCLPLKYPSPLNKETQGLTDLYIGSWLKSQPRDKVLAHFMRIICKFHELFGNNCINLQTTKFLAMHSPNVKFLTSVLSGRQNYIIRTAPGFILIFPRVNLPFYWNISKIYYWNFLCLTFTKMPLSIFK